MEWDKRTRKNLVDFFNYYCSLGPMGALTEDKQTIIRIADILQVNEPLRIYRQEELGGYFSSFEQLQTFPGLSQDQLEAMIPVLELLNLEKLRVLVPKTTQYNQVNAYVNGPDNMQVILEEIRQAKRYIHVSMMLFFNDKSGNLVVEALLEALARGVVVRMMVDYGITLIGYEFKPGVGDFKVLADKLEDAGAHLIDCFHNCYSGLDWDKKRAELKEKGVAEEILYLQDWVQNGLINDLNVVNHRKFIVLDGITSIIGSLNIGDQYMYETPIVSTGAECVDGRSLGIPRKETQWHDGCFRIRGELALPLNRLFHAQWMVLGGDSFEPNDSFYFPETNRHFGEEECTLLSSFPSNPVNMIKQYILDLITYAAGETIIVNPYLIDDDFWDTLQKAGPETARHLSICNPLQVNDHLTNQAAVRSSMYKPFANGVSFYDYSHTGRFSHWKIFYDKRADCVLHGSYNLNTRSAVHDFEVAVLVKGRSFADKVHKMIAYDLHVSKKITEQKEFYKYPFLHLGSYLNDASKYFS